MTIPQDPVLCIDLHCHSTASDGALSPSALLERAAERGVSHLALTDHDTIAGFAEAWDAAGKHGVTLIPGVELSCLWKSLTIHVVGLDFDPARSLCGDLVRDLRLSFLHQCQCDNLVS